jgi:phosphatidylglycerol:prolipoprotein diacylglycerol transferase
VGRVSSVPWAVKFKGYEGFRHPSQLYESFKNFLIFVILWNLKDKKLAKGVMFWMFVLLYGVFRFIIEFFRMPDPQLGFIIFGLTMGQILNIFMIIIGGYMVYYLQRKHNGSST